MEDLYKEFGLKPNATAEQVRSVIIKERKKWSVRLNAASLEKRQQAENKLRQLEALEATIPAAPTTPTTPVKPPVKKTEPRKITKGSPQKEKSVEEKTEEAKRRAESFIATKNPQQALDILNAALKENINNAELLQLRGYIHHITEDDAAGFFSYQKAYGITKTPHIESMLVLTGSLTKNSEATQFLEKLDDSHISTVAKGQHAIYKLDYNSAFDYSVTAFEKDNKDVDGLILFINAASGLNLDESAFQPIFTQMKKIPADDRLIKAQLTALHKLKNFKECEKICKKIRLRDPNGPMAAYAADLMRKMTRTARSNDPDSSHATKPSKDIKTANIGEALAQFDSLIGLDNVKEQLETLRKKVEYDKHRRETLGAENLEDDAAYHFVFSGNPGTGKTTVARLFGEVFYHLGILSQGHLVETDRSGLVGQFIGETAQKTSKLMKEAMGGVLFIDEAYALAQGGEKDFGREAIDTLVKGVEDNRKDLIVILAGYKNDMKELMDTNPGLASRFTKYMNFEDYTEEQLLEIAVSIANKQKYTIDDIGKQAFTQKIQRQMLGAKFGNARAVRNLMNEAFEEKASSFDPENMTVEELTTLTALDFGVDITETPEQRAERYINELHGLIGLDSVKEDIENLIALITFQKEEAERMGAAYKTISMHMVFAGNPGTGKTTVARIYGNLLREIGILKQGQFIEVSRADLVASYLGQTAPKVKKACEDAFGGILFVDEAYALCTGQRDTFGMEAVNTLIKEMEDHREKLVVILAGYTGNMNEFLESNPGFGSRVSKTLVFEDYTVEQLWEIFICYANSEQFTFTPECQPVVEDKIKNLIATSGTNFGNARDVRKLFEGGKMAMIMRVQRNKIEGDDRRKLLPEDFAKL